MVNKSLRHLGILFALSAFSASAFTTTEQEQQLPDQTEDVERIQVVGQFPLSWYREQVTLARDQLFGNLNELIDDPDMHYICSMEKRDGSRIKVEKCRDAFEDRIAQESFQKAMVMNGGRTPSFSMNGNVAAPNNLVQLALRANATGAYGKTEIDKLKKEKALLIGKLYNENEEVKQLMEEFQAAIEKYQKAHMEKFGSDSRYAKNK